MKPILSIIALIFLVTGGCAKQLPDEKTVLPDTIKGNITDKLNPVFESNNQFAFDLYINLSKTNPNLFFSPFSISTALTMVYDGAKGETEKQMSNVLHLSLNKQIVHSQYIESLKTLELIDTNNFKLKIANALWIENAFECLPDYISTLKTSYNSELRYTNFISEPVKSCIDINNWVNDKTNGKITKIIAPDNLNSLTRLVLINAVYFKAEWASIFDSNYTLKNRFYNETNNVDSAFFMNKTCNYNYFEDDILQIVEIPYVNGQASMVIVLPRKMDGLNDLEKELTFDNYKKWTGALQQQEVTLSIPKFKKESSFDLVKTLSDMGMPDAFSLKANFSGISNTDALRIANTLHKALIEVNEEATEAAAATIVGIVSSASSAGINGVKYFIANHPFIYFITTPNRKGILFMGKINNI